MNRNFTPRTVKGPMQEKMGSIKKQLGHGRSGMAILPSPMSLKTDGEDHINIWDRSKIDLGKSLSHYSNIGFRHSIFDHFSTMEGFWYWLSCTEHDDRLRSRVGTPLRELSSHMTKMTVPNFQCIIMAANWEKINQHEKLARLVKESELPFDCYYVQRKNPQLRIRPPYAHWLIPGFEEIRKALKENREPNFEFLREKGKPGDDFHEPFNKILFANVPVEAESPATAETEIPEESTVTVTEDPVDTGVVMVDEVVDQ